MQNNSIGIILMLWWNSLSPFIDEPISVVEKFLEDTHPINQSPTLQAPHSAINCTAHLQQVQLIFITYIPPHPNLSYPQMSHFSTLSGAAAYCTIYAWRGCYAALIHPQITWSANLSETKLKPCLLSCFSVVSSRHFQILSNVEKLLIIALIFCVYYYMNYCHFTRKMPCNVNCDRWVSRHSQFMQSSYH